MWPTYAICLTISFFLNLILQLPDRGGDWKKYLWNLCFMNGYVSIGYIDRAHWYMTTLLSLILVMTIFKALDLTKKPESYISWMMLVVLLKILDMDNVAHVLGGTYVCIACIGFGFAALYHTGKGLKKDLLRIRWYFVIIVAMGTTWHYFSLLRILEIMIGVFLLMGCLKGWFRFLLWKPIQFLGRISYPLYLIHQNVAYTVEYYLMLVAGSYCVWMGCVALLVVLLLAAAVYWMQSLMCYYLGACDVHNQEKYNLQDGNPGK